MRVFEEIAARIEAVIQTRSVNYLPVNMIDGRYIPSTVVEPQIDGSFLLAILSPSDNFLQSETFKSWLDRRPSKEQCKAYEKSLRRTLSEWPSPSAEFKWPRNPPDRVYFLEGPSLFEREPDFIIDYIDEDGNKIDQCGRKLEDVHSRLGWDC